MLKKKWAGFAGQLVLIALSLLPMWFMSAQSAGSPPSISAFEVPLPESGQYFRAKMTASPVFP
ncbi:MAG: hypothetical protein GVY26_05975 [Bacteroidetes bacterium]|jgi:hypothetical protein|nr:hypothetical protein [Bacteroidota bacterium]